MAYGNKCNDKLYYMSSHFYAKVVLLHQLSAKSCLFALKMECIEVVAVHYK